MQVDNPHIATKRFFFRSEQCQKSNYNYRDEEQSERRFELGHFTILLYVIKESNDWSRRIPSIKERFMTEQPPASIALEKLNIPHQVFRHQTPVTSFEQAAADRNQRPEQIVRSILFQ